MSAEMISKVAEMKKAMEEMAKQVAEMEKKIEEEKPVASSETWSKIKSSSTVFPAGKYYVGDSCFVLEDAPYEGLLDLYSTLGPFLEKGNQKIGMFDLPGDGCYKDTKGRRYGVDAGHIAVLPINFSIEYNAAEKWGGKHMVECEVCLNGEKGSFGGTYITFENEFSIEYVEDNYISIEDKVNPANSFKIWIKDQEDSEEEDDY